MYTPDQVTVIRENAPISYEDAVRIAAEIGMSTRSVIAKTLSLELQYIPKPAAEKRAAGPTKAELVTAIEAQFGEDFSLAGLVRAPATDLVKLLGALTAD